MKLPRFAALFLLFSSAFIAIGAAPKKTELESMYDKAFREFDANHYDEALKALDAIDARQPDLAESQNLRGVVLMRKGEYDKAEAALRKALQIEPKFWNASFNLAEIPFLKKDWTEARNRFEALVAGNSEEMKGETSLLIQYKILLTFVLQGKENMVDWIVNKFESEKESPALYYANAAVALKHNNQKEAKDWMDAADKHYPATLNKLFAESFYEIGWLEKPAGESRAAIEITSTAEHAAQMKSDAEANFEQAERAFQQRDFTGALQLLDRADEGAPNDAKSFNLRGEIFMEQGKYDDAEQAFDKAVAADGKFREAQYNLAQIPFKKKDYATSRARLEKLFGQTPGGDKNQAAQLIKYKIFLTLLLEGKDAQAQQLMDQFKFTGDTPALYYAQSAWAFKHGNNDQGNDWIKSARKIYSPALNIVFADTFYDLGWLERAPGAAPATTLLAQANSTPAGPAPAMRFGESESLPAPAAGGTPQPNNVAATAGSSPAAVLASPAPVVAKLAAPAVAQAKPAAKNAGTSTAVAKAPVATNAHSSSAVTPAATVLAPERVREYSQSTFAEWTDHASEPQTLLIGGILLAGVALLAWLIVQQVRRQSVGTALYESSLPLTEPPFRGPIAADERRLSREHLEGGPPKLSLKLSGSEPAGRKPVFPIGVAGGQNPAQEEATMRSPDEPSESIPEVGNVAPPPVAKTPVPAQPAVVPNEKKATPPTPLRDDKEVSLAAMPKPSWSPAKAADAPPPAFITEPKAPIVEPRKPIVAIEAKAPVTPVAPVEKPLVKQEEPVGQGQPVPQLASSAPAAPFAAEVEPVKPEPAPSSPEQRPARIEPETAVIAAIAGSAAAPQPPVVSPTFAAKAISSAPTAPAGNELTAPPSEPVKAPEQAPIRLEPEAPAVWELASAPPRQSSVETPWIPSKIITTKPTTTFSITPAIMPESAITPISPDVHASSMTPGVAVQQPAGEMHTAVQLTFSLEIASMQLTPTFKMSGLQLKPTSKVVSMRLAPSQQPQAQSPMNLQVTFEVAKIELSGGIIGTIRLAPSAQEKPAVLSSPSFAISGLELVRNAGTAPVQLTPSHQEQASVQLTAQFQIAAIEFSPLFEITAIVLNSSSRNVVMQLPGSGPSSIDSAPVFEIENVQLGGNGELATLQVNPMGSARRA